MPKPTWREISERARLFSRNYEGITDERAESQSFWNEFFQMFGVSRRSVASFEAPVRNLKGAYSRIDLFYPGIVLAEHKSAGKNLAAAESQAFRYIQDLTREGRAEEIPRFVIVSDFARIALHDLEPEAAQKTGQLADGRAVSSTVFTLADLHRHVQEFAFIRGDRVVKIDPEDPANEKAYALMCQLHDELKEGGFAGTDLERMLVRVLFCLFADDTNIFEPNAFQSFIRDNTREDGTDLGARLAELFNTLNTPPARRLRDLHEDLAGLPYVNGNLFADQIGFASFNRSMRDALLKAAAFQWAKVSPAVFGSLFQGVMDDEERREQGAHYTSERDILKVIRSLFLDDLRTEFEAIRQDRSSRRETRLRDFHVRLRRLRFFDPACGCGNFLVITYRELRALEHEILRDQYGDGQQMTNIRDLIRVDVDQFYGIDVLEWPVRIAEIALWLMDHQMNQIAATEFGQSFERLPLTSAPTVVHGNALRLDWNKTVIKASECSYILGNPPFVGKKEQTDAQKADQLLTWGDGAGVLDYVTCWYRKAAEFIQGTTIVVAFVSTNSISQGEQVGVLWSKLVSYGLAIHFAHTTFAWESEARGAAHVHVVIIGFASFDNTAKTIFDYDTPTGDPHAVKAKNINAYLADAPNVLVKKRTKAINGAPEISYGSMMIDKDRTAGDDEGLIISDAERTLLLAECPGLKPYVRLVYGGEEFINGTSRWCLWLVGAPPQLLRASRRLHDRLQRIRAFRLGSSREQTRVLAERPALFGEIRQPASRYLLIPKVSSESRRYIPIGFLDPEAIATGSALVIDGAGLYDFGILSSAMHNAWMRYVCGRLESRYQYSNQIVYNNFPWPSGLADKQRVAVKRAAQTVLDVRREHLPPKGFSTLADLYDPTTMPRALADAHAKLDRAVERCYRSAAFASDRERVEHLFALFNQLTAPLLPTAGKKRQAARARRRP